MKKYLGTLGIILAVTGAIIDIMHWAEFGQTLVYAGACIALLGYSMKKKKEA